MSLEAPVGRVTVWRDQQRNVVPGRRLRDADANDNAIQKWRIARHDAGAVEVVADMECQLIHPAFELAAAHQRRVRTALDVGRRASDRRALAAANQMRLDEHPAGGHPAAGVEHVGGQLSHLWILNNLAGPKGPALHYRVSVRPRTPYGAAGST